MARGIRRTAVQKLPAGIEWATQVPVLVVPSAGHSKKGDGTDGALRRRDGSVNENSVRTRYPPCCDKHQKAIKVESLATEQELAALCSRYSQHHGHGKLYPERARLEWVAVDTKVPCEDCLTDYHEKQQAVA